MRINRYLASAGLGSRRSCEELVRDGKVRLNGEIVEELSTRVEDDDRVTVSGRPVQLENKLVLALHKPPGYICSRTDLENRKTIFDLLPQSGPRLFYVGRLDKDSEGLLIVTNDGQLCQELCHPKHKVSKTYEVGLKPRFDSVHVPKLLKGFQIESGYARVDDVFPLNDFLVKVVLSQGLKRQIRYMFGKLGYRVNHLKRTHIGGLALAKMKKGEFRKLTSRDLKRVTHQGRKETK